MRSPRTMLFLLGSLLLALGIAPSHAGRPHVGLTADFVHLHTDRTDYRLGETIWYRVHTRSSARLELRLLDPQGREVSRQSIDRSAGIASGKLHVPGDIAGGEHVLEVLKATRSVHRLPVTLYAIHLPRLHLSLSVVGDIHYPGSDVVATFRALDLKGRPVRGLPVEYLAQLGDESVRGRGPVTDAQGRSILRFQVPADARDSGWLAAGVRKVRAEAAVSQRLTVSTSVGSIDALPEGGSVIAGHPTRFGLLVRDLDGRTTAVEGRVVDQDDHTLAAFGTDERGLAVVEVPHEEDHHYAVIIDHPPGVERRFALPGATGHEHALAVRRGPGRLRVEVAAPRGSRTAQGLEVRLERNGEQVGSRRVSLGPRDDLRMGHVTLRPKSSGLHQVTLVRGDRALLRRTVYIQPTHPVAVSVKPVPGTALVAGQPVEVEVRTHRNGRPVAADVSLAFFQGDNGSLSLGTRAALHPELGLAGELPAAFPDLENGTGGALDAYLLVYGNYALPVEGIPLDGDGLAASVGLAPPEPRAPRAREQRSPSTTVYPDGFEQLLVSAHFTRSATPAARSHQVNLRVSEKKLLRRTTVATRTGALPQVRRGGGSSLDLRPTLYWGESVRTDEGGRAIVRFPLNHRVAALSWRAEGRSGKLPVTGAGELSMTAGFTTTCEFPEFLHVGDRVELDVGISVRDGGTAPIGLEMFVPAALRPATRTRLQYNPRKDRAEQRFIYDVVAPCEHGEFRLLATRGVFQEVHARPFTASHPEVQVSLGKSGRGAGSHSTKLALPRGVVPGSVQAFATVESSPTTQALEGVASWIRRPQGCFEQWTSIAFMNLTALKSLVESGMDPAQLEQAHRIARGGYERLLRHRHSSGGFSLFEDGAPTLRPTIVAVRQLALHEGLNNGRGRSYLETALNWLRGKPIQQREVLYLTLLLHDSGRVWLSERELLAMQPTTRYETALLAACMAHWPGDSLAREQRWNRRLNALLDGLVAASREDDLETGAGVGLMGSRGKSLCNEVLGVAAVACAQAGRSHASQELLSELARRNWKSNTQSSALAVRAFSRLAHPLPGEAVEVGFVANQRHKRATRPAGSAKPIRWREPTRLSAGEKADLSLHIDSSDPVSYAMGVTFRVRKPDARVDAPYGMRVQVPDSLRVGESGNMTVHIECRGPVPQRTQVMVRVGVPAGVSVDGAALRALADSQKIPHWELLDGYVSFYLYPPPQEQWTLAVPVVGRIVGNYHARPGTVYPYYESARVAYAEAPMLRVLPKDDTPLIPRGR